MKGIREEEPLAPAQLARRLRLRAPTVTHHLNTLRLAGLVQLTRGTQYVREYQETDQHTFHRPGNRDCFAINRRQWMDYNHFDIQVIQDPYVSASTVTSQARIELPSYNAGYSSLGSCDMHGGASLGGTTPSEAPWFCVRPSPGKCADVNDGSYIVAIQAHLPTPEPPPPPPTP